MNTLPVLTAQDSEQTDDLTRWTEEYASSGAYPRYVGWFVVIAPAEANPSHDARSTAQKLP